jgi:hypothetical protein
MRAPRSARNNIKEGGSINSNVTEGIPLLCPVESKVTAYQAKSKVTARNAMRAPCSARNNIKEGGSILEVLMDDKDDYYSKQCRIGANRIKSYVTEQLPMDDEDDYFSKECCIGANRIESFVTEPIPMEDEEDYFLRNAVLETTGSKAMLLNKCHLSPSGVKRIPTIVQVNEDNV